MSFSYDLADRTLTVATPPVAGDPSTGTFTLFYDSAGRMYKEQCPDGKSVTATLDLNGNVPILAYPDSSQVTSTFDNLDRATAISGFGASVALAYDSASRRMSQINGNMTGQGYKFDQVDNLMAMTIGGLQPNLTLQTPARLDYAYSTNDVGQNAYKICTSANFLWHPMLASTISYGTANNLNQYPSVNSVAYTYDNNGCLTGDGTNTYAYDTENRLTSVTTPGATVSFKYDPFGRLTVKTVGSSSTRYLYSGMQRIEEYDIASGSLLRRYIYGIGLDECLFTVDATTGNVLYLHADETGSTIMTTDSTGTPTRLNVYSPWGMLASGSLADMPIGYTGQFYEPVSALYFYKSRHYCPALGRFLQPDPIGYQGGLNMYEYAGSDPVNSCDPLGLFGWELGLGVFGGGWLLGGSIIGAGIDLGFGIASLFGGHGPSAAQLNRQGDIAAAQQHAADVFAFQQLALATLTWTQPAQAAEPPHTDFFKLSASVSDRLASQYTADYETSVSEINFRYNMKDIGLAPFLVPVPKWLLGCFVAAGASGYLNLGNMATRGWVRMLNAGLGLKNELPPGVQIPTPSFGNWSGKAGLFSTLAARVTFPLALYMLVTNEIARSVELSAQESTFRSSLRQLGR